jgi:cytochrome c553
LVQRLGEKDLGIALRTFVEKTRAPSTVFGKTAPYDLTRRASLALSQRSHIARDCIEALGMLSFGAASILSALSSDSLAAAANPAAGREMAAKICAACHGADGNSVIVENPTLARQHLEYLEKQLKDFRANKERKNAVMQAIATGLSDTQMKDVAAHYAAQKPAENVARNEAAAKLGETIYRGGNVQLGVPACAGCHGPAGAGIPVQYPRLAGQHKNYVVSQLKSFRRGERANDANAVMRTIAARLNDTQIDALGEYIAGLR